MGSGPQWTFRPAGIEFHKTDREPDYMAETPRGKMIGALTRLADKNGILIGKTKEELAAEAGVPPRLACIELGVLLASRTLLGWESEETGLVLVIPDYEDVLLA
jgi:hypothetical protein